MRLIDPESVSGEELHNCQNGQGQYTIAEGETRCLRSRTLSQLMET